MLDTSQKVKNVFAEVLQKSVSDINDDCTIFVDLEVESVEGLELEFSLEEEFNLTIDEKSLWKLPGFITSKNMITDDHLNKEAKELVRKTYSKLSDDEIDLLKSPADLHKYLTVMDVISYIEKYQDNAA